MRRVSTAKEIGGRRFGGREYGWPGSGGSGGSCLSVGSVWTWSRLWQ